MSGSYDPAESHRLGDRGSAAHLENPMDYVENLTGEHLDRTTGVVEHTRKAAETLEALCAHLR